MSSFFNKKAMQWITRLMLGVFSIIIIFSGLFVNIQKANAQIPSIPFGGTLDSTDYVTCNAGFIILSVDDTKTGLTIDMVYPYILDLIRKFSSFIPKEIPIPTLYAFYNVFIPGVELLGKYVPFPGAPCLAFIAVPPFITVVYTGSVGYFLEAGTSLTPFGL